MLDNTREMIACGPSDDSGAEHFGGPPPPLQLQTTRSAAESCDVAADGRVERARLQQADRSALLHGLCAAAIALATIRVLPALAASLFSVCVMSPRLRTLMCSPFQFLGQRGRKSAGADAVDHGGPGNGVPPVPLQRRPLAPPATGGDAVLLIKRGLRMLTRVMRRVRHSVVIRPKRSRRLTPSLSGDTAYSVTNVTSTKTVDTVTGSRAGNDYVHCSQRQYLVCTTRKQR